MIFEWALPEVICNHIQLPLPALNTPFYIYSKKTRTISLSRILYPCLWLAVSQWYGKVKGGFDAPFSKNLPLWWQSKGKQAWLAFTPFAQTLHHAFLMHFTLGGHSANVECEVFSMIPVPWGGEDYLSIFLMKIPIYTSDHELCNIIIY